MGLPVRVGGKITAADINNIAGLPVASFADLPGSGNWLGRTISTTDTGIRWQWNGTAWTVASNGTRVISVINAGGTISSATFANVPSNPAVVDIGAAFTGQLAKVTYSFAGVCSAGTMQVGVAVSGATTLAADVLWTGTTTGMITSNAAFVQVFGSSAITYTLTKIVSLSAGTNTFTAQARQGGAAGTKTVADQNLTVELVA